MKRRRRRRRRRVNYTFRSSTDYCADQASYLIIFILFLIVYCNSANVIICIQKREKYTLYMYSFIPDHSGLQRNGNVMIWLIIQHNKIV
jgi:hypothetical protein